MRRLTVLMLILLLSGCREHYIEMSPDYDQYRIHTYTDSTGAHFTPWIELGNSAGGADTVFIHPEYAAISKDSAGMDRYELFQNSYLVQWTHDGLNIQGDPEAVVSYNVGVDVFDTRQDMLSWLANENTVDPESIWYGKNYGRTRRNEFEANGEMYYEFLLTSLPKNKYIIVSVQAVDGQGNTSRPWKRMRDFYLIWR